MTAHMTKRTKRAIHTLCNDISMRFSNALKFSVLALWKVGLMSTCGSQLVARWVKFTEKKGSQDTTVKQEKSDNLII